MEEAPEDLEWIRAPSSLALIGCSGSSKSTWILKFLKDLPIKSKIGKIYYMYGVWQDLYQSVIEAYPSATFVQGLNEKIIEDENNWSLDPEKIDILIVDDNCESAVRSETYSKMFTTYSHHRNIINIYVTQNPYIQGKYSTTINRNCQYYVLFKMPQLNVGIYIYIFC